MTSTPTNIQARPAKHENARNAVTWSLLIPLLCLAALSGRAAIAQDTGLQPVRIAVQTRAAAALLYWAEARGDFAHESLQVELQAASATTPDAIADGDIDLLAGSAQTLLQAASDGFDLRGLLVLGYSVEADAVLGSKGISDITALRGASIAIVDDDSASSSELLLSAALQGRGLNTTRVTLLRLSEADAIQAIASGEIEALVAGQPALARIEKTLAESSGSLVRLADPSRQAGVIADLLIGEERWLRANKDLAKRVIRVWDRVIRAQRRDPQAAAAGIAQALAATPQQAAEALAGTRLFGTADNIEILRGGYQKAFAAMSVVLDKRRPSNGQAGAQPRARGIPSANRFLDLAPLRQVARGR